MVDRTAFPRVRCASGNPLSEPRSVPASPSYTGPRWPGFQPTTIVVINPAPPVTIILLFDPTTGLIFGRIPGSIVIIDIDRPPNDTILLVVEPGQPSTVSGANWPPGTVVEIRFDNPVVLLATVTAGGDGSFSVPVTVPATAAPGVHQVTMTGGGFTVNDTIYVIPPRVRVTRIL
jgi:hypothetical protein